MRCHLQPPSRSLRGFHGLAVNLILEQMLFGTSQNQACLPAAPSSQQAAGQLGIGQAGEAMMLLDSCADPVLPLSMQKLLHGNFQMKITYRPRQLSGADTQPAALHRLTRMAR